MSAALKAAIARMAECLGDGMTATDAGCHFTCYEAESIADVLIAGGHEEAAATWIKGHASGDDDPGDMHHDQWRDGS